MITLTEEEAIEIRKFCIEIERAKYVYDITVQRLAVRMFDLSQKYDFDPKGNWELDLVTPVLKQVVKP